MTRLIPTLLAALVLVAGSHADAGPQPQRPHPQGQQAGRDAGVRSERDVAYGPHARQRYDVHVPAQAGPGAPILVMVHGGGWRRGDKDHPGVTGNKAAHWLARGFVFVSVNYRLLPDADPLQQAGDVAAAVASVQRRAPGWGADPKRLVLMGHSAGAHLVALLGSDPHLLADAGAGPARGVVSLDSGALDVPALMGQRRVPQLYRQAFGSDPGYWSSVSPQQRLGRDGLPMLLVCSSTRRFPTSPCAEARKFADRAAALGVPMRVLPEPLDHGEINRELGLPSDYTRAVSDWIDQLLNQRNPRTWPRPA